MDGLVHTPVLQSAVMVQQTLRTAIDCTGIGVHTGLTCRMALLPAPVGTGIVFHRTDLGITIPARFDHVVDTRLCTVLGTAGVGRQRAFAAVAASSTSATPAVRAKSSLSFGRSSARRAGSVM